MSAQHTPEPWKAFGDGDDSYIDGVMNYHSGEGGAYLIDGSDVRRIVACVNACAGATDEQLEGAAGKLFTGSAIALWSSYCDVKQQRDALQQRCEELVAAARFGVRELSAYGQEAVDVVVRNLEKAIKQVQPCNTPTK